MSIEKEIYDYLAIVDRQSAYQDRIDEIVQEHHDEILADWAEMGDFNAFAKKWAERKIEIENEYNEEMRLGI